MANIYSFRLSDSDAKIKESLDSLSGRERSEFIRSALQFYIDYGEKLNELMSDVKDIKKALTGGVAMEKLKEIEGSEEEGKIQEHLVEGIMDILNM